MWSLRGLRDCLKMPSDDFLALSFATQRLITPNMSVIINEMLSSTWRTDLSQEAIPEGSQPRSWRTGSCQWAPYLIIWPVPRFYLVLSLFYQRCFIQVQQEVLTTELNPPCSVRIWSRAILLSNITHAKELKFFVVDYYCGGYCNSCPKKKCFSKSGTFPRADITQHWTSLTMCMTSCMFWPVR